MKTGVEKSATPKSAPTRCDAQMSFTSLSRISRARREGALPGVVLDDAHAIDHLAQDVDPAVRADQQLLPDLEQHHERRDDEDGRAPQVVQQLEQVLQLIHVV